MTDNPCIHAYDIMVIQTNYIDNIKDFLIISIDICQQYCLDSSARWSAELLNSYTGYHSISIHAIQPSHVSLPYIINTCIKNKEWNRVHFLLQSTDASLPLYFKWYSKFMIDEQKKICSEYENDYHIQSYHNLLIEMKPYYLNDQLDAFSLYLYALIHSKLEQWDSAKEAVLSSIQKYDGIWSAWLLLSLISQSDKECIDIMNKFSNSRIFPFEVFLKIIFMMRLCRYKEAIQLIQESPFSECPFLFASKAECLYHLKEYESSENCYQQYRKVHPYSIAGLDQLSNMYYVQENQVAISALAEHAIRIDPFRIETHFILGNLFSLQGNHDKAMKSFNRCITLDPYYVSAWTLLGHEWLEKKDMENAINSYQKAIQLSPGEYRAWFGLGRAFESGRLFEQALFYYKKACLVKPNDPRIWNGLANIYESMDLITESKSCYKKAISITDTKESKQFITIEMDSRLTAFERLGKLYIRNGNEDEAAECYEKLMQTMFPQLIDDPRSFELSSITAQDAIEPCLFLANYYSKRKETYHKAIYYSRMLLEIPGPEKEEAKMIINKCYDK